MSCKVYMNGKLLIFFKISRDRAATSSFRFPMTSNTTYSSIARQAGVASQPYGTVATTYEDEIPSRRAGPGSHSRNNSPHRSSSTTRSRSGNPEDQHEDGREDEPKYILTLKTSRDLHETMTALRKKYFPPARNKLQAHITLFHALKDPAVLRNDLTNLSRFTSPFQLSTHLPQLRGTFLLVKMDEGYTETCSLRAFLRDKWSKDFEMSQQDLQMSKVEPRSGRNASWEAHWTIMNKEPDKEKAKQSFEDLQAEFTVQHGVAEGLSLWEYMADGTWRHEHDWLFQGGRSGSDGVDGR